MRNLISEQVTALDQCGLTGTSLNFIFSVMLKVLWVTYSKNRDININRGVEQWQFLGFTNYKR
jgi:hypothetical protein